MTTKLENVGQTLCARIDGLSTSLLLDGVGSGLKEQFEDFATEAAQRGFDRLAELARSMAKKIQPGVAEHDTVRQGLCVGLIELRETLGDCPAREGTAEGIEPVANAAPSGLINFCEDAELISDFLVEAREHLASIESRMLELERNPHEMEVLHSVFRTFHTIKGLAGFLAFDAIQSVAHEVESLLDRARTAQIEVTSAVVDVVLECADDLKAELNQVERQQAGEARGPAPDKRALIEKIRLLAAQSPKAEVVESPSREAVIESDPRALPASEALIAVEARPEIPAQVRQGSASEARQDPALDVRQESRAQVVPSRETQVPLLETAKTADFFSVRVETAKLDHLLNMVGEMVIAQSLIRNNPLLTASKDARLVADIAQLSRNTAEVQRTTMSMRMIPIGQLFQRTSRLVRDLSRKAGKRIVLETAGDDTEVDKTIAEQLSDPLLHMVRNSVDHGIETPVERQAAGKNPEARILLKAYHQAGQIVIEISDDGRGLNREKILAKAAQNGIIEAGAQLPDAEVWQLIFEPGFSTAEKISDVSGRGVGMDVVRRNVQKLRGRIDTHSIAGEGTTFLLKLPLTLAIIEGLVVMVGSSRYIVPIFAVREIFRPTAGVLSTVQGRHEMALVRGNLLPIIRLNRRFGIDSEAGEDSGLLVVVEFDEKQFCLMVDDLVGKQEVVIKSLGEVFKDVSGVSGCAILGDGRVGLILDMEGIYRGGAR